MADEVSIRHEPLTIPTYRIGPAEQCPMFYAGRGYQGAKGPIYPYPLLDKLTDTREDRTYDAIYLENRYLQLCVLPELGGRIFSGLDKTNNYDFIYRQHVIKPALIGMLGAWISGGVEWDIPHHHRPTTFMPIDYHVAANPDGSRTLWLGEIERRHRMKWIVGLTLRPDRSYLEVTIRLFNRTPYVHSFLCFTNLAVHVNDTYQVIFPPSTEWGTQHAKCEFIRWPIADGTYAGVDYSAGVDVSWWKNHPDPLSIFAWNDTDDFFGGYDHGRQAGIVHFADHHTVPGKKFFTFGNGAPGRMWDKILTDTDGPYVELMAGAFSDNQPDYSWIQPGETKDITEYWYPIRDLGGIKNANRDAAVNLDVDDRGMCRLAFNTTEDIPAVTVLLRAGDRTLFQREIRISPAAPFVTELALPQGVQPQDLHASLELPSGRELIAYQPIRPKHHPKPQPVIPPAAPKDIASNEDLYLAGLRLEQFHSPASEPDPYYEEALKRDPDDIRANTALGILYCKRGVFEQAEQHLRRAVQRLTRNYTRPKDGEPLYYLGVALDAQDRTAEARDWLERAAWSHAWHAASHHLLARIACRRKDWSAALAHIGRSLSSNSLNTSALSLKTALLRVTGRLDDALALACSTLAIDPLDWHARNERVLALLSMGQADAAQLESQRLVRSLQDPETWLELAADYEALGLWDEAIDVLTRCLSARPAADAHPMLHYALDFYAEQKAAGCHPPQGRTIHGLRTLPPGCDSRSTAMCPQDSRTLDHIEGPDPIGRLCFPFRWESAHWLRAAIRRNPADSRAHYYLGNLLYDHQPRQALLAWEESRRLDPTFWLVHRNLAIAYARFDGNRRRAIASLRRAIECNPREPRLFLELDQHLEADGAPAEDRLSLLECNHAVVAQRDDALLRQISLHVLLGQYDRAIELLDSRHFHIWEGGEHSVHDIYVDVHLLKGRRLSAAGRHRETLAEYLLAAEYPDRFEVGEPNDAGRAAQVFYHVGTAHDALSQPDQARAAFQRAARKARKGTDLPYYQGLARRKLGDEPGALACFNDLMNFAREMLAGTATDFFEKFGARRTESARQAQAHYLSACASLGLNDPLAARQALEQAIRLDPTHLWARTLLASLDSEEWSLLGRQSP